MYWQEDSKKTAGVDISDAVVDLVFSLRCKTLPVDHAYALSCAVVKALPWMEQEPVAGVHTIHVAESGNGWMRPDGANDILYLSRRTKFTIRLPKTRVADALALSGQTLDVVGHPLHIESGTTRLLSNLTTLFARYLVAEGDDESTFLKETVEQLAAIGVKPKKMLCGIAKSIQTPGRVVKARSLMLAELTPEESIRLQQQGLGSQRLLGCGLFIPHKDIKELAPALD